MATYKAPEITYGNFKFVSSSGYLTPKVNISVNIDRTQSKGYLGTTTTINLDGIIMSGTGMYAPYANFLKAVQLHSGLFNQEKMSDLVIVSRQDGGTDHHIIFSGSAVVDSVNFDTDQDPSIGKIPYTVSFQSYQSREPPQSGLSAISNKKFSVNNVQDSYEITPNITQLYPLNTGHVVLSGTLYPTYTITRNMSAQGNPSKSGALHEAASWINYRSLEITSLTGIVPTGIYQLYNFERDIDINDTEGRIGVRDRFLAKPLGPPFIETCTISTSVDDSYQRTVNIQGSIQGLEESSWTNITGNIFPLDKQGGSGFIRPIYSGISKNLNNRYDNAISGYNQITGIMFVRADTFDKYTKQAVPTDISFNQSFPDYRTIPLNPIPISITEGLNPAMGTINYSVSFNTRPLALISGALTESLRIDDNGPAHRYTPINIIGRRLGPLLYFPGSKKAGSRTVTYEGVFHPPTGFKKLKEDTDIMGAIDNLLDNYKPESPYTGLLSTDNRTVNFAENRILHTKTWQYTKCSDNID